MDSCVKSVIFALILGLTAWDITCIMPQGQPVGRHKLAGSDSLSLIQQESNLPPVQPGNSVPPPGSPTLPQSNRGNSQTNLPQITRGSTPNAQSSSSQQPGSRGNVRDYVNPQAPTPGQTQPLNTPTTRQTPQQSQVQNPTANNRGNVRDYVNPQASPGVPSNRQTNSNSPSTSSPARTGQPNTPANRGATRDYVNPSISVGQNANTRPSSPTQQGGVTPISYANAASGSATNSPKPNTNARDYVAPQRPGQPANSRPKLDFPALPNAGRTRPNPSANSGVTPAPFSYAQKVSGGVTTKSPLNTPKQSPPGPPGSTTSPKPDDGPTDVELKDFSEALLRRDVNNAAKYVTTNVQGKTTSQSQIDEAPKKLLEIHADAYQIPTIAKLKLLHNNYILDVTENEHVTAQERAEENDLLDTMITTPIMQYTKNFLISNGKLSKDPKDFKDLLKALWFNMYSRAGGKISSSGFEHIFLAELKKKEVSGLHNWIYFDQAEMTKLADYLGYMKIIDFGEKGSILKFHFKLNGVDKPVDSMFIGTSPELEMALYTTCYVFRADRVCPLRLNGKNFVVRTYNIRYRGKNMIGSAFPEI